MNKAVLIFVVGLLMIGCKKPHERRCYKSNGEQDSLVYSIDAIYQLDLGNRIRYRIFQDSSNQIVVHGGKNVIPFVEINQEVDTLRVRNQNRCAFLRNKEEFIQVDIHCPDYHVFRCDITDSLLFIDTIVSEKLDIKLTEGGGYMELNVEVNQLKLDVTDGVTNFKLGGIVTGTSAIHLKVLSYGDARGLISENYLISNNSTGDFYVNLDQAYSVVKVWGTGDVFYTGEPDSLIVDKTGDGNCIPL